MSKLIDLWDKFPQNFRDAVGRFVKIIGVAAGAAALAYAFGAIKGGSPVNASDLLTAVGIATLSAAEKFFEIAPKVAAKVRRKKPTSKPASKAKKKSSSKARKK